MLTKAQLFDVEVTQFRTYHREYLKLVDDLFFKHKPLLFYSYHLSILKGGGQWKGDGQAGC